MKLYRWEGSKHPNLGDEITTIILKHLNIEFECTSIEAANVFSTGSILAWPFSENFNRSKDDLTVIVGSGLMAPIPYIKNKIKSFDNAHIISVRGHLSHYWIKEVLKKECLIGDPGLIVSNIYPSLIDTPKEFDFGFIPHHSQFDKHESFLDGLKKIGSVNVIDFRTDDAFYVFKEMNKCKVILSQGLHGLIFADSFGIPNAWLDFGGLHMGGEFKFYDYFSSIRRPFDLKVNGKEGISVSDIFAAIYQSKGDVIRLVNKDVENSFLRAVEFFN